MMKNGGGKIATVPGCLRTMLKVKGKTQQVNGRKEAPGLLVSALCGPCRL